MSDTALVDLDALVDEANALLAEGFNSIDQRWRDRSTIKPVENFKPCVGVPKCNTYAKMVTLSDNDIASGEYRNILRRIGAGAGENFLRIFEREVQDGRAIISFLNGQQSPCVDAVKREGEAYVLRGYHDFGIMRDLLGRGK